MKSIYAKFAVLLSAVVLTASPLLAETMNERDYKQLRADRDKAAAAALEPINRRYKEELEKLFKRATQAAELDLARQVQAELQAAGGASAAKAAEGSATTTATGNAPVDKTELRKLFENSDWEVFGNPNGKKSVGSMVFERNGKMIASGINYSKFYSVETPDVLKLYDRDPKKDPKELFRLFKVNMTDKTATQDLSLSTRDGGWFLKYIGPSKNGK